VELPDSFYELSPSEVQYLLRIQKERRIKEEQGGFKTRTLRAEEEKSREKQYPKVSSIEDDHIGLNSFRGPLILFFFF
jgi:hypothetical protein